ncbi:hypothetical protein Ddye_020128 [Dipteronia dyeriana]|uniref:DUF659 domain-containing protein n=1 Tax=Dipteronia dyeriana TaxID=168575 RepID=A0AAD9U009_9ROSI|nr:hypothetical protein Ddye_020128 [Dipteronia dyeriana]
MDQFVNPINPKSSTSGKSRNIVKQHSFNDTILKERTHATQRYVTKLMYQAGIPFNVIDNDCFFQMVETICRFGPSFKPLSQWQLKEPLLKEEFETTKQAFKKQEQSWKVDGCSIMTDAWTVGHENIVQVVTDNASNNMVGTKMLKVKMPYIFWSSCATHTINLMRKGICKLPKFKNTFEEAKSLTNFIYTHHITLALMRKFTRKRNIMRLGVTRFASAFLILQSLLEKKDNLRAMFTSTDWEKCKRSKSVKGKSAYNTVLSTIFWNRVKYCIRVFSPLVRVLRLADGDRKPSMRFLYKELKKAKEKIREGLRNVEIHPVVKEIGAHLRRLINKRKRETDKKVDILLANDAINAQGWIVDDGDDEVEPGSGLDDGDVKDLEDDFQSNNSVVEENIEFASDDDVAFQLDEYVVEDEALETLS